MKTLLLILSLILITTNAYAEWTYLSKNEGGDIWFYDKSSVKRNGDKVKVWTHMNFVPDKKAKFFKLGSVRTLDEIDCVNETVKRLSMQTFTEQNLEGDMRDVPDPNPTTTYIPPDSVSAVLIKLVCKK